MRLTEVLLLKVRRLKHPNGHMFRGKYRWVKQVTIPGLNILRMDFEREEKNMLLLRHPYLTLEQSKGHMKDEGKLWKMIQLWRAEREKKFQKTVTLAEHLGHLRVREAWD